MSLIIANLVGFLSISARDPNEFVLACNPTIPFSLVIIVSIVDCSVMNPFSANKSPISNFFENFAMPPSAKDLSSFPSM